MYKEYIITNFAYGTGPYLMTADLAIAFNNELEKQGQERLGIIIPWVYGEKQKKIMLEEFSEHEKKYPGEILLDAKLGEILKSIFYGNNTYEEALNKWVKSFDGACQKANRYLSGVLETKALFGNKTEINGKNIVVELHRSPRILYNVAPSYFSSFAYIAEILEQALGRKEIAINKDLLLKGVEIANRVEQNQKLHCIAYPATFSYDKDYQPRYATEILVPPITRLPQLNSDLIDPGIFVTITGIFGLEQLYAEVKYLGIRLYSNDAKAVAGSIQASPHIISNQNILFQFARSGWSSVWLSMLSETPLIIPEFNPQDDPEIYFNNRAIEESGIGIIYRGQSLKNILQKAEDIKRTDANFKDEILNRWGILDGNRYCARLFVKDFLGR